MGKKIMYCSKCGEQLDDDALFCRFCGNRVKSDNNETDTADNEAYVPELEPFSDLETKTIRTGNRQTRGRSRERRKSENMEHTESSGTKNGIRLLAIVLALAVFAVTAFKYPGFLLPKEETEATSGTGFAAQNTGGDKQKNGTDKQIDYTATNETDKLSPEKLSAEFEESGVSVTLTEWVLDDGQEEELQVRSMKPLYDPDGEYVIKAYEVTLGDIHELDDFVEIRIPYDTSFCDEGEDPAECVGGLYYNEENSVWEEVLYTVDAAAGEIVIETDHFSRFGAITLKNKGRRDAMLCMAGEKITADYDIGYLDEDQAINVMQQLCDTETEESETSKLAGNQVLQQAMDLSGRLKTVSDGLGTAFSFAYYLDLSDVTMAGRYVELSVPGRPAQGYLTPIFFSNSSNVYNTDMINKASRNLSRVGNAVSACKLVYLIAKAGTQGAADSEIWEIYKESASLTVNLVGGVTLGALLAPISLADTFISGMYEDAMAIKESQIEEMYMYFNQEYPGSEYRVICRAGRSLKDWRKVIIKLIEENPEADSADLLRAEIDDFADDFWTLNSDQISDVVAQMPKTIKRITVDDERIRRKITNGYKEELYKQLTPVLTSVRNYYNKKMVLKVQQQITAAVRFYNKTITFDIAEEDPEKEVKYGGCRCIFAPLYDDADVSNWSSTLPENGPGLTGEMTLIGHITSGSPDYLLVFDKDADITQDDPILSVPFTIDKDDHIQIILKEPEEEEADISKYMGKWYDAESMWDYDLAVMEDGIVRFYGAGLYWVDYRYEFDPKQRKLTLPAENITGFYECETLKDEESYMTGVLKKGMVFTFDEEGKHALAENSNVSMNLVRLEEFLQMHQ